MCSSIFDPIVWTLLILHARHSSTGHLVQMLTVPQHGTWKPPSIPLLHFTKTVFITIAKPSKWVFGFIGNHPNYCFCGWIWFTFNMWLSTWWMQTIVAAKSSLDIRFFSLQFPKHYCVAVGKSIRMWIYSVFSHTKTTKVDIFFYEYQVLLNDLSRYIFYCPLWDQGKPHI